MSDIADLDRDARSAQLELVLDELILKVMINLNERGFSTVEILDALDEVCEKRHREYNEDPDPANEPKDQLAT